MNAVTIATFNESAQAEPLKHRLESENIPAEIVDESKMQKLWFVGKKMAHIRLKVASENYERSMRLLSEWHAHDGALSKAVRCPDCGSARVEYPQFTRKFFLPNILGLLSAIGLIEKEFYCNECQYTWPVNGLKLYKAKAHTAPDYFLEGVPHGHK